MSFLPFMTRTKLVQKCSPGIAKKHWSQARRFISVDGDVTFFHNPAMKKPKTTKTKTERPPRVHLTKEEVLERMKTFSDERSGSLPLLERVRVEVYFPDPAIAE